MKPWYSLPAGPARSQAKAKFEATVRPVVRRGPRPGETEVTPDALIIRGVKYAYADHGGPDLARMLAHAACPPLPSGCRIEFVKRAIIVDGIRFERNAPAFITRLAYENFKRARKTESLTEDDGPTAAA